MKKMMKRLAALLAAATVMLGSSLVVCAEEGYTYNYDLPITMISGEMFSILRMPIQLPVFILQRIWDWRRRC